MEIIVQIWSSSARGSATFSLTKTTASQSVSWRSLWILSHLSQQKQVVVVIGQETAYLSGENNKQRNERSEQNIEKDKEEKNLCEGKRIELWPSSSLYLLILLSQDTRRMDQISISSYRLRRILSCSDYEKIITTQKRSRWQSLRKIFIIPMSSRLVAEEEEGAALPFDRGLCHLIKSPDADAVLLCFKQEVHTRTFQRTKLIYWPFPFILLLHSTPLQEPPFITNSIRCPIVCPLVSLPALSVSEPLFT